LEFASAAAQQPGFQNIKQSALQLATKGLTSIDEVMRVSFSVED
jgi:MSHA biogenesis protein MshE